MVAVIGVVRVAAVAVVAGAAVAAAAARTSKSVEHAIYKRPRNSCHTCEITFHISILRRFVF